MTEKLNSYPHPSRLPHIVRNVLVVAVSFGLAAAAGLVRNMVIAAEFGIGADLDAYYAAFKLPDLLFTIVAGGALATAFIPVFADFLADRRPRRRLAAGQRHHQHRLHRRNGFSRCGWHAGPMAGARRHRPRLHTGRAGPDGAGHAHRAGLHRHLRRQRGAGQRAQRLQAFPAARPGRGALSASASPAARCSWRPPWASPAWPWARSSVQLLHLLVKVPGLFYYGFRWWPVLDLRGARSLPVRRVFVLMGPRILDLFVFQFSLVITTNLASRLGAGSVSALEWGWDAMQLPGDHHRHGFWAGRLPDPGRAGRARRARPAAQHAGRDAAFGRRSDRARGRRA